MSTEPNKVIYSMVGVSKYYDKKAVLKDIYLSYFYGAKIGVIGLNGSGKSSLLRILAGADKDIKGEVQEKLDHQDAWDLDARLEMAMDALRCPAPETPVKVLSGGERRRVALCRLLLQKPDILLLDEPTNHLDAESVAWLEHHLQDYAGTVIAVTHDRYFLDNVAGWILELDRGEGIPLKGNYTSWLEQKQERLRRQEKSESERQKTLERELEWVR